MSKAAFLPLFGFTVHTVNAEGSPDELKSLTAAYFQESGRYTVFKDVEHTVVEAFRTDLVTRVVRTEQPVG